MFLPTALTRTGCSVGHTASTVLSKVLRLRYERSGESRYAQGARESSAIISLLADRLGEPGEGQGQ